MQNEITEYISELDRTYQIGNATEHSYRPALQQLLKRLMTGLTVTNEPRRIGLRFTNEKQKNAKTFAPIDLLDYIYAVLHSPSYRERYKEFLKVDFPRVPYPDDAKTFWKLVQFGGRLRKLHLMEEVKPKPNMANYPVSGNNKVEKLQYLAGKVSMNETQYFDNVPPGAWDFYVGGYQPARKWLKDRKGRALNFNEIQHYQKIIRVFNETIIVMGEVEEVTGGHLGI